MMFAAICVFKQSIRNGFFCCAEPEKDQVSEEAVLEYPYFRQITFLKVRWGSCHGHRGYLAPLSRERVLVTFKSLTIFAFNPAALERQETTLVQHIIDG